MQRDKGLFWLASYPKSGNTWLRIVLSNALSSAATPIDFNQLKMRNIASSRTWADDLLGFNSAELNHDELDQLRPLLFQWYSNELVEKSYHKIHDAYTFVDNNVSLIPAEGCLGAVYIIRNPLDVAISMANHSQRTFDETIEAMGDPTAAFYKKNDKQHMQLRQWLLTWSQHVQSWTMVSAFKVLVIRYEDMKYNSLATFTKAIEFLQLGVSQEDIKRAVDNSQIETLQRQEEQFGFNEKPAAAKRFFRKGVVGDWENTLTSAQIERIISAHGEVMKKYGYLDSNQNPICYDKA